MKKITLISIAFVLQFMVNRCYAQTDTTIAKNTIYVEGLGNGIIGSINYDRLFIIMNRKISMRIGVLYLPIKEHAPIISVPIETCFLLGKTHHFESSIGLTYSYGFSDNDDNGNKQVSSSLILFPRIGYRLQNPKGDLFFRIGIGVFYKFLEFNDGYKNIDPKNSNIVGPSFNIAIGHTFKRKK